MIKKPDWLTNFEISDFQCHCARCAGNPDRPYSKEDVLRGVQMIRNELQRAVDVTRGVSCPAHNAEVGGADDSRHLPQHADGVDIGTDNSHEAFEIVRVAMKNPAWKAFRVYAYHVHLDQRPGPALFISSPED